MDPDPFSRKISRFIQLALDHTTLSEHKTYKHAALIFDKRVIAIAANSDKTSPLPRSFDQLVNKHHAESLAIKVAGEKARGATVISVRKDRRNAKPCNACRKELQRAGVKRVIYSTTDEGWKIERIL